MQALEIAAQWLVGALEMVYVQLTEVVLTPQSNSGVVGEGAGGVSTHSKFSSEVLLLILHTAGEFCKRKGEGVEFWTTYCQAGR